MAWLWFVQNAGHAPTCHSPQSGCEQLLLRAVLTCTGNHLFGDDAAERPAGDDVTAVVDAGPDARLGGFRGKGVERGGIAGKEIAEDRRLRRRVAAMRGRIAGMIGCRDDSL